jgi:hypothetical protein
MPVRSPGRGNVVPYKDKALKKARDSLYKKAHYQRNKEAIQARIARNKRIGKDKWLQYKSQQSCVVCGASHPAIIDFHHVVRDGTQQSVNRMAADSRWLAIYKEIEKCVPLCSNCHRIGHFWETHNDAENMYKMPGLKKYFRIPER